MTGKLYPAGEKVADESLLGLSPDGDDAVDIGKLPRSKRSKGDGLKNKRIDPST